MPVVPRPHTYGGTARTRAEVLVQSTTHATNTRVGDAVVGAGDDRAGTRRSTRGIGATSRAMMKSALPGYEYIKLTRLASRPGTGVE